MTEIERLRKKREKLEHFIFPLLRCVNCFSGDLNLLRREITCRGCGEVYPLFHETPIMILHPGQAFEYLPSEVVIREYDLHWCNIIEETGGDANIDLSGGTNPDLIDNLIKFDMFAFPHAEVVGDAETLPFKKDSINLIISGAGLEHFPNPFLVVDNVQEVLIDNGKIYIETGYLASLDAYQNRFFNMTKSGIEELFSGFEKLDSGILSKGELSGGVFFFGRKYRSDSRFHPVPVAKRPYRRAVKSSSALSEKAAPPSHLSRFDKVMSLIDKNGLGLEIGPGFNPLAPKKQGFNVHVLDHVSTEELREKFQGHGVNLDDIEEVDYVWKGEPLPVLVGQEECYDWIIASHVIEHTPDMISFLEGCERLLKPHGVLSLIIPDKRYCFDHFHATTSTGEILDAFEQKRTRPSPGKVFDHCARHAKTNGQIAWGPDIRTDFEFGTDFSDAARLWLLARTNETYFDVHNWRFTPASFRLLIGDLHALGLTGFGIKKEFGTAGCEFYVTLGKNVDGFSIESLNRMELLKRIREDDNATALCIDERAPDSQWMMKKVKQFIHLLSLPLPRKKLFIDMFDTPYYQLDTSNDPFHENFRLFVEKANKLDDSRILEVGSRHSLAKSHFSRGEYTGFDIRPGEAVDVVGDVHHLSEKLEQGYFDFVFSLSSFEHFAMPWKAILEINKVMKDGGILFVSTHPAWPPHELPWDFWRYGKGSFNVLLNRKTGFEIIQCSEGLPASIVPYGYEPPMINMHKHPAHLGITALARKIGPSASNLSWDMNITDILDTTYPA